MPYQDLEKKKETERAYRAKNKEKLNERARERYSQQREKNVKAQRARREKNSETYKEYDRKWYSSNAEKRKAWAKERRGKISQFIKDYKSTLRCTKCAEDHPGCIVFHHKDPSTKESDMSGMIQRGWSIERILEEISKCEVLCANCHHKHHWSEKQTGYSSEAECLSGGQEVAGSIPAIQTN